MNFRFQARNVGLTYPQCGLEPAIFAAAIYNKGGKFGKFTKIVIGEELHADGGQHYHVYIHWPLKMHTTDVRYFDIEGYHPNIMRFKGKNPQVLHHTRSARDARYARACRSKLTGGSVTARKVVLTTRPASLNISLLSFIGKDTQRRRPTLHTGRETLKRNNLRIPILSAGQCVGQRRNTCLNSRTGTSSRYNTASRSSATEPVGLTCCS